MNTGPDAHGQGNRSAVVGLIGWLGLCYAVAAIGGWASVDAPAFYGRLTRPVWAPPAWLFFVAHAGGYSTLDIAVMWLLVAATLNAFARIEHRAGWLLVPYLLWASFALALNIATWRLNPGLL